MKPLLALVGRPNVGKSTLFNRLIGRHAAVVDDRAGVTRDRIYADAILGGRPCLLIDTGGFETRSQDEMVRGAVQQARMAIEEADLVVLVCDARDGLHPLDQEVAGILRKCGKPVVAVANKADPGTGVERETWEFSRIGLECLPISALHGTNLNLLEERIGALLPVPTAEATNQEMHHHPGLRLCLLGRPNVGKSSLVNRLLGKERQLVSATPGTTRDAVDTYLESQGLRYTLVDTPGLRRKSRIIQRLEHFSVLAALRSLERAEVAAVILDGSEPFSDQDAHLVRLVLDRGRGLVLVVNKVDAWSGRQRSDYLRELGYGVRFASFAPVLTVSARTGNGTESILPQAAKVEKQWSTRIPTGELNRFLEVASDRLAPPIIRGKRAKIYYLTQADVRPPTFVGWVNDPARIPDSYRRYLERRLRAQFPFSGSPLRWIFRRHGPDERKGGKHHGKGRRGRRS